MAINLATSSCCNHTVRLSDIQGKPLEIRQHGQEAPHFGTRWDCPSCGVAYFVIISREHTFWSNPEDALKEYIQLPQGSYIPNKNKGRYILQASDDPDGKPRYYNSGVFTLDLSYYESFRDEPGSPEFTRAVLSGKTKPSKLLEGDAEDKQLIY
ncbi:MAG: hypothetical protein OEY01_03870 [Desulfobulbaceae bacterium]|nr:hypothetical protein [Desulfobulbaceae bacterium]